MADTENPNSEVAEMPATPEVTATAAAAETAEREREIDEHIAEVRERNRKLMEPDDDLRMPFAQKLVLGMLALIVATALFYIVSGS